MKYYEGYKYQLVQDEVFDTGIIGYDIDTKFIKMEPSGRMTVREDYAWDGPSGPTIDTKNTMRGALGHDAGYQLIREGFLPMSVREKFDDLLKKWCIEDSEYIIKRDNQWLPGVRSFFSRVRFDVWHDMVEWFAKSAAEWKSEHKVIEAP